MLVALAVATSGCTTTPTAPSDAKAADVVIPSSITSSRPNAARVTVRRDSGLMGAACSHAVRLDGKLIGTLSAGQEVTTYPNAGEHTLEATSTGAWCGANAVGGLSFVVDAGQAKVFRTGFSGFFDLTVTQQ